MIKRYSVLLFIALTITGCKSSMLVDPTTTIKYTVPERSKVKLTVENSYNTVVATLVDMEQNAGVYSVNFDASGYPEGVYFYRIQAGSFVSTKKLVLLK